MTRRSAARLVAAAATAALILTGCGGGGGGGDQAAADGAVTTPLTAAPATGVAAVPTDPLYGTPEAAPSTRVVGGLPGYDEFGTPRDGFAPLVRENSGAGAGGDRPVDPTVTSPQPTSTAPTDTTPLPTVTTPTTTAPTTQLLEADFDIGGEPVVARAGDAIPPGTQQFTVESITTKLVTLKLVGGLLPNGADTVRLAVGQSVTLVNQTTQTTYRIRLLDIRTP